MGGALIEIEALVLDFGNVISLPHDERTKNELCELVSRAASRPIPWEEFRRAYGLSRLEYDRGRLEPEAYWSLVLAALGLDPALAATGELLAALRRLDLELWFRFDPAFVDFLARARKSVRRMALLSNMNWDGLAALRERADWLGLFDGLFISCELGLVKPERAIYEACSTALGVEAGRCLFVDDMEANVAGAAAAGFQARLYSGLADLETGLGGRYRLVR